MADVPTSKASLQASCRSLKTPSSKGSNDEVVAETLVLYHLLNVIFEYIKIDILHLEVHVTFAG
jgi:hypothetical protein